MGSGFILTFFFIKILLRGIFFTINEILKVRDLNLRAKIQERS